MLYYNPYYRCFSYVEDYLFSNNDADREYNDLLSALVASKVKQFYSKYGRKPTQDEKRSMIAGSKIQLGKDGYVSKVHDKDHGHMVTVAGKQAPIGFRRPETDGNTGDSIAASKKAVMEGKIRNLNRELEDEIARRELSERFLDTERKNNAYNARRADANAQHAKAAINAGKVYRDKYNKSQGRLEKFGKYGGAAVGAMGGAGLGALIGRKLSKDKRKGALIGGAIGGVAGGIGGYYGGRALANRAYK